ESVGKLRTDAEGQKKLKAMENEMLRVLHPDAGSSEAKIDKMLSRIEEAMKELAPGLDIGSWTFQEGFQKTVEPITKEQLERVQRGS
ncbi:hypothetical protein Q8G50_32295, partial [Klebsiella pneumoniae]